MPAKSLKHKFASAVSDGGDTTLLRPSNWNDDHDFWIGRRAVTAGTDTVANTDHLSILSYLNACTVTLPAPSGGNMPAGWSTRIRNIGSAGVAVTVTGSGGATINGAASLVLAAGEMVELYSDGTTAYFGIVTVSGPTLIVDKGTVSSGTVTFDVSASPKQRVQAGGAITLAFSNWAGSGFYSECEVILVNGGTNITWSGTINWHVGDGSTSTTFANMGITLAASGLNRVVVWTIDGGTTRYGRAM